MKMLFSGLLNIYRRHPDRAVSLYYKLPAFVRAFVHRKLVEHGGDEDVKRLKRLEFFPLDSAGAEVVFAPFHDPVISPSLPAELIPLEAQGCKVDFFWCWTVLSWEKCQEYREAASFSFVADINVRHYDKLLACLAFSGEITLKFSIRQNNEWRDLGAVYRGTGKRMEIILPLVKGTLDEVRLTFRSDTAFHQSVQVSWFGLRNSDMVRRIKEMRLEYSHEWNGLIKPIDEWGEIVFEVGLLFSEKDLEKLRRKKNLPGWDRHFLLLESRAREYMRRQPERDLGEYLPFNDSRYLRESECGRTPYYFEALVLGFVGLINQDKKMMFHALRYLMCMLHTRHWTQSAESRLPGSTWDQRCFLEEMATSSVTFLSDWFAFALTGRAKELVRQSIWDKGLAVIDRDLMKYSYLYRVNQGAVFCRARILGGLYLERSWPRVGNYVDRAFSDMTRCLGNYIESDGGTPEGIGYFCQTLQAVLPTSIAYSRCRGKSLRTIIKKYFSRCEGYVAAMSGSVPGTAVVEGDCRTDYFSGDAIPLLAAFFPGGVCEKILAACIESGSVFAVTGTLSNSGGIVGFVYGPDRIPKSECVVPVFSILKKSGQLASFRENNGYSARLHLIGSRPNPSHSHFDKGAIFLELDAEQVLVDRGMVNYYFSQANELKRSYMHNVITPVLDDGTFPDQRHPERSVIPVGRGNGKKLHASIGLTDVWGGYMRSCSRSIHSSSIDDLLIVDQGELNEEGRLAFHLHSPFPFQIKGKTARLIHPDFFLFIEPSWAEEIICRQESINLRGEPVFHLIVYGPPTLGFKYKTIISRQALMEKK